MARGAAASPLFGQVKDVLGRKGYSPVEGSDLFVRKSRIDEPLSLKFVSVTATGVRSFGAVPATEESHIRFLTRNARFLFG